MQGVIQEKGKEFQEVKELVEKACKVAETVRVASQDQAEGIRKMKEIKHQLDETRQEHR